MDSWEQIVAIGRSGISYFRCDPPIADFTKPYTGNFLLSSADHELMIDAETVPLDRLVNVFENTIFQPNRTIISWDIKRFLSYVKFHPECPLTAPEASVVDLKYAFAYLGHRTQTPPQTFAEGLEACRILVKDTKWRKVNRLVHIPLATDVIPTLETRGVFSGNDKVLYACYEIEGQVNGRLSVPKVADNYLTVHAMQQSHREVLRPRYEEEKEKHYFIEIDFVNMEVAMLQWLTQDADLKEALDAPEDFYESLLDLDCDPDQKRKIGKMFFIPVVYGLQPAGLAKRLKIDESTADTLISGLKDRFPTCFDWLDAREAELAENPVAIDALGRCRDFTDEPAYKRRNFEVQSPASTVCLEKLCHLCRALPNHVLFHIHDGYILTGRGSECEDVIRKALGALESESEICPGLQLRTKCHFGTQLSNMKPLR